MKKIKLILQNIALITIILTGFIACERDFASIGSDIIGENNFGTDSEEYSAITYNQNIGPVQTNALPINLLGYNNHDVFGSYTANFVSQMSPGTDGFDPFFGQVLLDSVVLTIPYFSSIEDTDEDGNSTYELDSVFGNTPIKLSIYENNYFFRDFIPDSEFDDPQRYFSNMTSSDDNAINQSDLEGQLLYENDTFLPSADQITLMTPELDDNGDPLLDDEGEVVLQVSGRFAPGIRVHLFDPEDPTDTFWQDLIFEKEGEPELSNINNFLNHFRGLYFKAEAMDVNGTMMMLNFSSTVILYYSKDIEDEDGDGIPNVADADVDGDGELDNGLDEDGDGITDAADVSQTGGVDENGDGVDDSFIIGSSSYTLNFSDNKVNFFENNLITIPDGDQVNGDENLYLKGGQGSMALINLFNGDEDGNSQELEDFLAAYRKVDSNGDFVTGNDGDFLTKRLINQAHLEFFVDQSIVQGDEPERIFLYDANNSNILIDYLIDQSVSSTQIGAKIDHLQPLVRVDDDPDGEGIKYRIEITEHINNILQKDSTNVKLGLTATANVTAIESYLLKDQSSRPEQITSGAILEHRGTILFGNNTPDEAKKVKLTIFYTEPEN